MPSTGPMSGGGWVSTSGYGTPPGGAFSTPPHGGFAPASSPHGLPSSGTPMRAPGSKRGSKLPLIAGAGCTVLFLAAAMLGVAVFALAGGDDEPTRGRGNVGASGVVAQNDGDEGDDGSNEDDPHSSSRTPRIDLTFEGACKPRFNARLMVTGGPDQLNVMSSNLGGVTGSIMMSLDGAEGETSLSTQHRLDTQTVVNVMVGQRIWTNMTIDILPVREGRIPDPISGKVTVTEWDAALARADVTFQEVTLQNVQDGSLCTVNGRLQTFGTTYGM